MVGIGETGRPKQSPLQLKPEANIQELSA